MGLAYKVRGNHTLQNIAMPYLQELVRLLGESCCLCIHENDEVVYLDVVNASERTLVIRQRIGNRAPLHCTGVGKLFLSDYSQDVLDA